MSKLGVLEDTLFVPMLGRIYASEYCPQILYDPKALELKKKLPSDLLGKGGQSQYTLLASAARSANVDQFIRTFLERRPDGVVVQLGYGLETTYSRCDNGHTPLVCSGYAPCGGVPAALLSSGAGDLSRRGCLCRGLDQADPRDVPDAPILVTAGGLFHYFEENKVVGLLRMLTGFGEIEIVI